MYCVRVANGYSNGAGAKGQTEYNYNFDASRSNSIYGNSNTVQQEQIQYPYFIQVATGAETEDNIINEIELNNPYSFGDSKYSPVALNNLSWLKSEGQWNSKAVYPAYYDWALTNFNNGVKDFALSTDEYTDYDVVINPAEETFRLPLLDGSETIPDYQNYTEKTAVGSYVAERNCVVSYLSGATTGNGSGGSLTVDNIVVGQLTTTNATVNANKIAFVKRGHTYALGSTATFNHCRIFPCIGNGSLYFYVGETVQNANLINAGRIEEIKANYADIDGIYTIADTISLVSQEALTVASGVNVNYDVSNYLPNDGNSYLLETFMTVQTGATSNAYVHVWTCSSDGCECVSCGGSTTNAVRQTIISRGWTLIRPDRILRTFRSCSGSAGILYLLSIGSYRKVR